MAVAALSTADFSPYIPSLSNVGKSQQALQALQQSLTAGNLSAAQTAFTNYQSAIGGSTPANSQLTTDLTTLGSALTSGSLSGAQAAFATVQSDLKGAPSQAVVNAQAAVAQSVQQVDQLLNFPDSSSSAASSPDTATAILDSVYGLNSSNSTNPATALLESKYGAGTGTSAGTDSSTPSIASSGNSGSSASVNLYA